MKQIKIGSWRYENSNQTILFTIPNNVNDYEIDLEGGCGNEIDVALHLVETKSWCSDQVLSDYWALLSRIYEINPNLPFFTEPNPKLLQDKIDRDEQEFYRKIGKDNYKVIENEK
jgi:hypothetical protein